MKDFLTFRNRQLDTLVAILNVPLDGQKSRIRNRFITFIQPRLKEVEEERLKMAKELADKDEKGEPIMENSNFKLSKDNLEKFQKEYTDLLDEEYIIDILESNKKDIDTIKDLILNTKKEFDIQGGYAYEELCKCFEAEEIKK